MTSYLSTWTMRLFFFNDTATTEIYTLSLHDALPISAGGQVSAAAHGVSAGRAPSAAERRAETSRGRSEEHTSELQSRLHLVCRLLLEKKNRVTLLVRTAEWTALDVLMSAVPHQEPF